MDNDLVFYIYGLREILTITSLIDFVILLFGDNIIYLILITCGIFGIITCKRFFILCYVLFIILFNIYYVNLLSIIYYTWVLYCISLYYNVLNQVKIDISIIKQI